MNKTKYDVKIKLMKTDDLYELLYAVSCELNIRQPSSNYFPEVEREKQRKEIYD